MLPSFALLLALSGITSAFRSPLMRRLARLGANDFSTSLANYSIPMPVDHFNATDERTFQNRYWVNDTYYRPGGPVFFYDFGEQGVTNYYLSLFLQEANNTESAVMQLAKKFNGLAVLWEHRFYGESQPIPIPESQQIFSDVPYKYVKYLTLEQALEDTVYFANHFQPPGLEAHWSDLSPKKTPWVWIGGSYPGARGAWIRIRNPEIFHSVWASSAVVETPVDGSDYFDALYRAMLHYNPACLNDWHAVVNHVDEVLANGTAAEVLDLKEKLAFATVYGFNETDTEVAEDAKSSTAFSIANQMADIVFDNYQSYGFNRTTKHTCDFLEKFNFPAQTYHGSNVSLEMESVFSNPDNASQPAAGIVAGAGVENATDAWANAYVKRYAQILEEARQQPSTPYVLTDVIGWSWQTCSELGLWQVSNTSNPHNLIPQARNLSAYHDNPCKELFSFPELPFRPNVSIPMKYGGWDMKPSNVYFGNGQYDPWVAMTVASTEAGAPMREMTTKVPQCGKAPAGNKVFGVVYPDAVHATDLMRMPGTSGSSIETGLTVFSSALKEWLKCFKPS